MRPRVAVVLTWRCGARRAGRNTLLRAARAALADVGLRRGALSIVVTDDAEMADLHQRHLNITGTTDVLTFDLGTDPAAGAVDGEIVVCREEALRVAGARGLVAELALYVVHGVLHLAGFDDHKPADYRRMHAREDAILSRAGLGAVFSTGRSSSRL